MEKALWNDKEILAFEVSKDYEFEKLIRKVSGIELLCPDENCTNRALKYCHGDVKQAYFAHKCNVNCSYDKYDKETTEITRDTKRMLYQHLCDKGYTVQMDVKLVEGHYSHLVITENGVKYPIDILSKFSNARQIDKVQNLYAQAGLSVNWVVTDISADMPMYVLEEELNFAKRFSLNETETNELLTLNVYNASATQYRMDTNPYVFDGQDIRVPNFEKIFNMSLDIETLVFENGRLTINTFDNEFNEFILAKHTAFGERIAELVEEKEQRMQRLKLIEEMQKKQIEEREKEKQKAEVEKKKKEEERRKRIEEKKKPVILNDEQIIQALMNAEMPEYNPLVKEDYMVFWNEESFKKNIIEIQTNPETSVKLLLQKLRYCNKEQRDTFKVLYRQRNELFSSGIVYALEYVARQLREDFK